MGIRRLLAVSTAGLTAVTLVPLLALGQAVDQAEQARDEAHRLVSAAVANRDEIEAELLAALDRYQDLAEQLTQVSIDVERLRQRVVETGIRITQAKTASSQRAVTAYMQAVAVPPMWTAGSLEDAMVVERSLAVLRGEDLLQVNTLNITERDLRLLQDSYQSQLIQAQLLQGQVEAEADRLQTLFAQADSEVAGAIAAARQADVAYRSALDEVARARAAEEERIRKENQAATTTTTAPPATTATTTVVTTTSPTTNPQGPRTFRPSVERWRSTVAAYFPESQIDGALAVIQCESFGDPDAYNPYSGASGLFQFLPSTWAVTSVRAGVGGESVFDGEANIAAAAWLAAYYESRGLSPWSPWSCKP
jgi:hypothetical protein